MTWHDIRLDFGALEPSTSDVDQAQAGVAVLRSVLVLIQAQTPIGNSVLSIKLCPLLNALNKSQTTFLLITVVAS